MNRLALTSMALSMAIGACRSVEPDTSRDWRGFRNTDGSGRAPRTEVPLTWDADTNVAWRTRLPGPGTSSPIVVGDAVFVTCWSGYGTDPENAGDPAELERHVLRIERETGRVVWDRIVERGSVEDPYEGRLAVHGYASSTPASDGARVYAFFGKAGVHAFDLDGNPLWSAGVGERSSEWNTGSAGSVTLWGDLVIVNAADEGRALFAFDKLTGDEVWRREFEGLDLAFGTPVMAGGTHEPVLLFALLEEVWGLAPDTGETIWAVNTKTNGALAPTIIVEDDVAYSFGGQTGTKSCAIRLGGEGDVSATHVQWTSRYGTYVTTPLLCDGHLYWVEETGMAHCAEAATGELVYRERLESDFYASPILAGGWIYIVSRRNGTFVLPARPEFEVLAHNEIETDTSSFDATPAVSGDLLILRSGESLYGLRNNP